MFNNNLYHICSCDATDSLHCRYRISFVDTHPIFFGHFPQRPIVPGACSVEVAHELINLMLHNSYAIIEIKNLKFVEIMAPNAQQIYLFDISLILEGDSCFAKVMIVSDNQSHCYTKLNMKLIPE